MWVSFSDFLIHDCVIFFINIKYKWGKTCLQVSGLRDLVTADGDPILAAVIIAVYSIQTGVEVIARRKVTPFESDAIIEIVYITDKR